ncbi:hypothetical protein MSTO_57390 [Mycobacterium stomatepiae]|uniref:Uncharacterized protein n=1 Tax=Mycobacterium stomatepiae TaxID=470076 RepID=A0A7I7QGT7_9MYCO|nr:hypothetical protein MSTO_57390 [Mycobacterium stomatepiae]
MTRAIIRRDNQIPHARSGGTSPLNGRKVYALTAAAAAPRDRSDPRAGTTMSAMPGSQPQMVTFANGSFAESAGACRRGWSE